MAKNVTSKTKKTVIKRPVEENVLVISQVRNKVILPYKKEELLLILGKNKSKYKNLHAVIDEFYTIPLSQYKCACVSRFKEGYKLARERANSTFLFALDLALELFFTRYLHPAIVTACKNLDCLDVYMDCLDRNELEDFPFFEIRYELLP